MPFYEKRWVQIYSGWIWVAAAAHSGRPSDDLCLRCFDISLISSP
jgi:hypothetical protein